MPRAPFARNPNSKAACLLAVGLLLLAATSSMLLRPREAGPLSASPSEPRGLAREESSPTDQGLTVSAGQTGSAREVVARVNFDGLDERLLRLLTQTVADQTSELANLTDEALRDVRTRLALSRLLADSSVDATVRSWATMILGLTKDGSERDALLSSLDDPSLQAVAFGAIACEPFGVHSEIEEIRLFWNDALSFGGLSFAGSSSPDQQDAAQLMRGFHCFLRLLRRSLDGDRLSYLQDEDYISALLLVASREATGTNYVPLCAQIIGPGNREALRVFADLAQRSDTETNVRLSALKYVVLSNLDSHQSTRLVEEIRNERPEIAVDLVGECLADIRSHVCASRTGSVAEQRDRLLAALVPSSLDLNDNEAAWKLLAEHGSPQLVESLLRPRLRQSRNSGLTIILLQTLVTAQSSLNLKRDLLADCATQSDVIVRATAIRLAAKLRAECTDPRSLGTVFLRFTQDPDPGVRALAAEQLSR